MANWTKENDEDDQGPPEVSDWGKFAGGVLNSALKAILLGWVAGGFLFYSYADPVSNIYDPQDPDPLLNINIIALLCGGDEEKEDGPPAASTSSGESKGSDAKGSDAKGSDAKGPDAKGSEPSSASTGGSAGGAQSTLYACQIPRSKSAPTKQKKECPMPYSLYPGKEAVDAMVERSKEMMDKWSKEFSATKWYWKPIKLISVMISVLAYWFPLWHNGSNIESLKGKGVQTWWARSTALTWGYYRYILATIFCASTPGEVTQPFFRIQFLAFLYAYFWITMASAVMPVILPFLAVVCQIMGFADEYTAEQRPGLPLGVNIMYWAITSPFNMIYLGLLPVLGLLYFAYLILFAPLFKDKTLFLSTMQCNQFFITLIFATFVVGEGRKTLDPSTFNYLNGAYWLLVLRYLYQNLAWFKALLAG